jgi:hypothetical protein
MGPARGSRVIIRLSLSKRGEGMKRLLGLLLACALSGLAGAQAIDPSIQKLAVLSLIGDEMTVDTYRPRVGTGVDNNRREAIPVPSPVFDHAAIFAAVDALTPLLPASAVSALAVPAAGSLSDPNRLLAEGAIPPESAIVASLRQGGFSHLLLISKYRGLARLQLKDVAVGSGHLRGIGFYIDRDLRTKRSDTEESAHGFIAPYVYIRLTLVDLSTLAVRGERTIAASYTESAARNERGFDPWGALTPEQKVGSLKQLIERNVSAAAPLLVRVQTP